MEIMYDKNERGCAALLLCFEIGPKLLHYGVMCFCLSCLLLKLEALIVPETPVEFNYWDNCEALCTILRLPALRSVGELSKNLPRSSHRLAFTQWIAVTVLVFLQQLYFARVSKESLDIYKSAEFVSFLLWNI